MWLVLVPYIVAVVAWRWAPTSLAVMCSVVALLTTMIFSSSGRSRRAVTPLAILTIAVVLLRLLGGDQAFPCSLRCAGAESWGSLFGVNILWLTALSSGLVALIAWRRTHLPVPVAAYALAWMMAGGSLAYVVIAINDQILCLHCFACHTLIIGLTLATWHARARWQGPAIALIMALTLWTTLTLTHQPTRTITTDTNTPTTITPEQQQWITRIEDGRSRGPRDATIHAEVILDIHCSVCASVHHRWLAALRQDPSLRITTHILLREPSPDTLQLAQWLYASAAQNAETFASVLDVLLGTPPDSHASDLRIRLSEVVDIDALDAWTTEHRDVLTSILTHDQDELARLNANHRTPTVLFRSGDREIDRLEGNHPASAVTARLQRISRDR